MNSSLKARNAQAKRRRREKQATMITFSVQDRLRNARNLLRSEMLRHHLCPLSKDAVAMRLHTYQDAPTCVLDEGVLPRGRAADSMNTSSTSIARSDGLTPPPLTTTTPRRRRAAPTVGPDGGPPVLQPSPPAAPAPLVPMQPSVNYHEWLELGCPTTSWSVLLSNNLYGPQEAEELFYYAKYSREGTYELPVLEEDTKLTVSIVPEATAADGGNGDATTKPRKGKKGSRLGGGDHPEQTDRSRLPTLPPSAASSRKSAVQMARSRH